MANQNGDDDNDFFNMDLTTHRYPNGWNEDNWEAELEQHPLFMTKQPDNEELPPIVEALQQLKYGEEDNSPDEIAENHKADGNLYFKAKKYRKAIDCYTQAIKQKPQSKELNSVLHANRSASNFYLENYRSSLMDALKSVELNSKNNKAIQRVILCLNKLGKYDHLIKFCDNSGLEIPDLEKVRKEAEEKLKIKQRDQRKLDLKEKKAKDAVTAYQNRVLVELSKRKVRIKGDIFKIVHPAAHNARIQFDEDGSICFPVMFVYPEVAMCDYIEKFNENDQFYQHLITMLDDENNLPEWNSNRMFKSDNVTVKFKNLNDLELQIDKYDTLSKILSKIACTKPPEEVKDEVGLHKNNKTKVEINLGDCLACSGCITSAETVLIQQQSDKQVYQVIEANKTLEAEGRKVVVLSLSFQAIGSIASKYELDFQVAAERLSSYFKSIGVDYVFDISFARHLALHESQREFINRYKNELKNGKEAEFCVLSSICPGFVCYVEKTHGELLTPLLSTVKSPQQVFGTLLKQIWSSNQNLSPDKIFHISLMPCFDKKLEASRKEFIIENEHEVDCVLTPVELNNMLVNDNCDLKNIESTKLDNFLTNFDGLDNLKDQFDSSQIRSHLGSGSGGYAENVYRMISAFVFDQNIPSNSKLNFEMKRNKDFMELDLLVKDKVVFRTAIVNGFRNIQTLIQRIKRGTCKYNYVEVMACPSGCLNGGGLLRDVSNELIEKIYLSLPSHSLSELESNFTDLYSKWFKSDEEIQKYLHTKFNIIPKQSKQNSININW